MEIESYLLRAKLNPLGSITLMDTASDLQFLWPCCQGFLSCLLVSRTQHDNVTALQVMLFVEFREMTRREGRDMVRCQFGRVFLESPSHDLLDFTCVQIDARAEFSHPERMVDVGCR